MHPDRLASEASRSGPADMAVVNEAYRVLGDPGRRAVYDRSLTGRTRSEPAGAPTAPAVPATSVGPARVPWALLAVMGTLGIGFVLISAAMTDGNPSEVPDGIIESGSCVVLEQNGDAREVACTGDPSTDLVVGVLVPLDARCPVGTEPHRDRLGLGIACLET